MTGIPCSDKNLLTNFDNPCMSFSDYLLIEKNRSQKAKKHRILSNAVHWFLSQEGSDAIMTKKKMTRQFYASLK
jgi:hypothetical protein